MTITDRHLSPRGSVLVLVLLAAVVLLQCSVNPATGERELSLVSEAQEIAIGRQADPEIVAQFGLYPDQAIQAYVADLGSQLAAQSERPDLPWTFRVLDDPLVNAFALPGGYVYVTRGILTHLDSEAELVGVLGHEIGHVTARHSASRMSNAMLAQVGLLAGAIADPEAAREYGGLAQQLAGLLFLKFGRDDERQADRLAVRYSVAGGFDPNAMLGVFETLDRVSRASGGERLPGWASTHPSPADRTNRLARLIDEQGIQGEGLEVDRQSFLRQLDGMVFGDDPRQGFFRDDTFYHPELRFELDFPEGWLRQNTRRDVTAISPRGDAVVTLRLVSQADPASAERSFFEQQNVRPGENGPSRIHGLEARTREFAVLDSANRPTIVGRAAFVAYRDRVYQILGYQRPDTGHAAELTRALESFAPLRDRRLVDVEPMRVQVVRSSRTAAFSQQPAIRRSSLDVERLALLNGVNPDTQLSSGTLIKSVEGIDWTRADA